MAPISKCFSVLILLLTLPCVSANAQDVNQWSRFRGPNGSGVATAIELPADPMSAIAWRHPLPTGCSSPIIWGQHLYVESGDEDTQQQTLHCFDVANGEELWKQSIEFKAYHLHNRNSYGSATPVADDSGVYIVWGSAAKNRISKFNHDGDPQWEQEVGGYQCNHGSAFTLVVVDGLVICPMLEEAPKDGEPEWKIDPRILAFDCKSGDEKWSAHRPQGKASFSTPCVIGGGDTTELIFCNTADGMFSINPKDGSENWALPVFEKRTVSSTVVAGDLLIGTNGSGGGGNYLVAVRPPQKPGQNPEEVYRVRQQAPYVPTPVFKDGMLFLWSDKGIVSCIDAVTGKSHWRERIGSSASSSPVCIGDQLVCIDDSGDMFVIDAKNEYELVGNFSLGATTRATPAVAGERVYFRTESELIAIKAKPVGGK